MQLLKHKLQEVNDQLDARTITYLIYQVYHNNGVKYIYTRRQIKKQIYHASSDTRLNSCGMCTKTKPTLNFSRLQNFFFAFCFTLAICKMSQYKVKRNEWKILEAIIQLFVIPNEFSFILICPPEVDFWYIKLVNSKVNDISKFAKTLDAAVLRIVLIIIPLKEFALMSWDLETDPHIKLCFTPTSHL